MAQNSFVLNYKKVEYPPDFTIPATTYSDPDDLITIMFGSTPIREFHGLVQIEFTANGKSLLFPDLDNILSRSESAKDWWFLPPEFNGEAIYQSETDISSWWGKFQGIYKSSILSKRKISTPQMVFLKLSSTNDLVESLFNRIQFPPDRLSTVDQKDPIYPDVYSYNLFRDYGIENYWRAWVWKKAIIHYYHVIFAPTLLEKTDDRKVLRLSNRFPEYANAVGELATLREMLDSKSCTKGSVDKLVSLQATELKEEAETRKKASGRSTFSLCQCRVCGIILPVIKNQGMDKQICDGGECKKAWGLLRKSLPANPTDPEGGNIRISHI
jgi:hypothetical protein